MCDKKRCSWANKSEKMMEYHDKYWAIPIREDNELFRRLSFEIFQSGLSWNIILNKIEYLDEAFDNFNIEIVSKYSEDKVQKLLENEKIIKNEKKLYAIINNAKCFIKVKEKYGSFSKFIWSYVFDTPVINPWTDESEIPSQNYLSDKICEDMKDIGFEFIGSKVIYAFLQSIGLINDHIMDCDFKFID